MAVVEVAGVVCPCFFFRFKLSMCRMEIVQVVQMFSIVVHNFLASEIMHKETNAYISLSCIVSIN